MRVTASLKVGSDVTGPVNASQVTGIIRVTRYQGKVASLAPRFQAKGITRFGEKSCAGSAGS